MPWIATSRRSEGAVSISSAGSNFQVALATRGDFQLSTETIALASRIIAKCQEVLERVYACADRVSVGIVAGHLGTSVCMMSV